MAFGIALLVGAFGVPSSLRTVWTPGRFPVHEVAVLSGYFRSDQDIRRQ
jgi:hypothetical protein